MRACFALACHGNRGSPIAGLYEIRRAPSIEAFLDENSAKMLDAAQTPGKNSGAAASASEQQGVGRASKGLVTSPPPLAASTQSRADRRTGAGSVQVHPANESAEVQTHVRDEDSFSRTAR